MGVHSKVTYKIKDLPIFKRPREKLKELGPDALSNFELLAILLNSGSRKEDVMSLSKRIIDDYGQLTIINTRNVAKLQKEMSLSFVKACQIIAFIELGKRLFSQKQTDEVILSSPSQVYEYVKDIAKSKKEILRGLYLNVRNKLIYDEIISLGNIVENISSPQLIFLPAIKYYATGIIIVHNHPSGDFTPSESDIKFTEQIVSASKILKIPIIDHLIVSIRGYYSFKENNLIIL